MGNAYSQSPQQSDPQSQPQPQPQVSNKYSSNVSYTPNLDTTEPISSSSTTSQVNSAKRARKKQTGIRLSANQVESMPSSKICQTVEVDDGMDEAAFLSTVQETYGQNARVEINRSSSSNVNPSRKNISYQVAFNNKNDCFNAYSSNASVQAAIIKKLNLKGSDIAFDKPCEPQSIDGITLQLDSDSSSILCGACLVYNYQDECVSTIHYSNKSYNNGVIEHSGDTQIHGKSVHTIKLGLSDLDKKQVKQLFFTLCACGPNDLSLFKEPVISLHENDNVDINLVQYSIEQAGKARSVVMCRIFRAEETTGGTNWSIQALGTEEWHIPEKICMKYEYANQLIDAHLKLQKKKEDKKENENAK